MKEKFCPKCETSKPLSDYYFVRTRNCYYHICKKCKGKYQLTYIKRVSKIPGTWAYFYKKFSHKKASAKKRKIVFNLTLEQFKKISSAKKCFYCENIPKVKSIDRVDSKKGYSEDNCVLSCLECNILKGKLTHFDNSIHRMVNIAQKVNVFIKGDKS